MNKNTKEWIIGGLTIVGICSLGTMLNNTSIQLRVAEQKIEEIQLINDKHKEKIESQEEELTKRDATLEEYRTYMDKQDKKIERLEKVEKQHKECPTRKVKASRGTTRGTPIQMKMTFYGDFAHENGGYAGIDAQGNKLVAGTVASNVYPFGTTFSYNGQIFTVRDRGGRNFNSYNRLDVFVPRKKGESDAAYARRISIYGVKTVTMYKN